MLVAFRHHLRIVVNAQCHFGHLNHALSMSFLEFLLTAASIQFQFSGRFFATAGSLA